MAEPKKHHCTVCGKEFEGGLICPHCEAVIRGEAIEKHHQIKKDAEREFHKDGVEPAAKK